MKFIWKSTNQTAVWLLDFNKHIFLGCSYRLFLKNCTNRVSSRQRNEVKLFARCSLLFARCLLLFTVCSLLVTFCSFLVTFCSLLFPRCSMLVTFCSLLVTFCSLLVTFCWLLVTFSSLLDKKFGRIFF